MKYLKIYENFVDSRNSGENTTDENVDVMDNFESEESQFGPDEILARWDDKFGDDKPSTQNKYEFYSDLREEGFDGVLIFDVLGDKFKSEESDKCPTCAGSGVDSEESKCLTCNGTGTCEDCEDSVDDNFDSRTK